MKKLNVEERGFIVEDVIKEVEKCRRIEVLDKLEDNEFFILLLKKYKEIELLKDKVKVIEEECFEIERNFKIDEKISINRGYYNKEISISEDKYENSVWELGKIVNKELVLKGISESINVKELVNSFVNNFNK